MDDQNMDQQGNETPMSPNNSGDRRIPFSPERIPSTPHEDSASLRTPLTPGGHILQRGASTPNSAAAIPRGDVGRNLPRRIVPFHVSSNFVPATPGTPLDATASDTLSQTSNPPVRSIEDMDTHQLMHDEYAADTATGATIWGTDINFDTCRMVFRNFLYNFFLDSRGNVRAVGGVNETPYYLKILETLYRTQDAILNLDCSHLRGYVGTARFYKQLISFPQEIIPAMDDVVNSEFQRMYGDELSQNPLLVQRIQVRTYNLAGSMRPMRDLNPENIDQLVSLKGLVIRCSPIIPDIKQAYFRCFSCSFATDVVIVRGKIDEPTKCDQCRMDNSMELIHNRCLFSDKQLVRLQENINEIPEGETPQTTSLFVFDDLVDTVKPGDRVEVVGIYRAIPRRVHPRIRTVRSLFKTYIDVVHFRHSDQGSGRSAVTANDDSVVFPTTPHKTPQRAASMTVPDTPGQAEHDLSVQKFSDERIKEFQRFVRQGNVYDRLVKAFAPSIWELDDVKRGILCQLFGGSSDAVQNRKRKRMKRQAAAEKRERGGGGTLLQFDETDPVNESSSDEEDSEDESAHHVVAGGKGNVLHERRDINILLCGDPGTSKSQLLSYVHKLTPRGIYTSGKGSSAVGLTASVVRDPETKDLVLESGALVLSDNGICCIDEFDKMSDSTRAILHEAMEQQTVSITKAGIIATLNARTSVLASANPVESRYNPRLSVVANLKLPPTLLSRFDLIYLVLDKPNPDSDRRLAKHLVSLYYPDNNPDNDEDEFDELGQQIHVDQEFLRDFIQYARHNCAPSITKDAGEVLVQGYLQMRSMGGSGAGSKTISATPRQLESLIRLSQALAKMRLSDQVAVEDVQEAIRLMRVATQAAATDPRTGIIDMDMITTGRAALDREAVMRLTEELTKLFEARRGHRLPLVQIRQLIEQETQMQLSLEDIEEALLDIPDTLAVFVERTKAVLVKE